MNIFKNPRFEPFIWFVYAGAVLTAACLLSYAGVQQNYRQSLNDPQIQMAEDAVLALERGEALLDLVPAERVAIDETLRPFIVLYDTEGNPIVGNGYLGEKLLEVPKGVFDNAKAWGENDRTLEPKEGVRVASVIKPFVGREANGFVLAGRNMRVVEEREASLSYKVFLAWFVTLGGLFVLSLFLSFVRR